MMNTTISHAPEYRPCFVDGKKALFHRWVDIEKVVDASPMVGGHPGGQIRVTLALVEYEDGRVQEVYPERIKFCPGKMDGYAFPEGPSTTAQCLIERPIFKEERVWCPFCKGDTAVVCTDTSTKEIFVYCPKCKIETKDTFKSRERALNAFSEGKTRGIHQLEGGERK